MLVLRAEHHSHARWAAITISVPAFAVANAAMFSVLSYLEHAKSRRPSGILLVYLLLSCMFDATCIRTMWLVEDGSALTCLFTVASLFKVALMILEATEKRRLLLRLEQMCSPEETSSIYNRGVFYWLNKLLWLGARRDIGTNDMWELPEALRASQVAAPFMHSWRLARIRKWKHPAVYALLRTLKWHIIGSVSPRIALLLLTICTPIISNKLLAFLEAPIALRSSNVGLGLIGAFTLVYISIAISGGLYWANHFRTLTLVRACLVTATASKTGCIESCAAIDPKAALTLMSADVERIMEGLENLHEFWANLLQVAIATYLLKEQIGFACFVPVLVAAVSAGGSLGISALANERLKGWMAALQVRIGAVSETLPSMRGVKMMGLEEVVQCQLRDLRVEEIRQASTFRLIRVWGTVLSFAPELLSPALTFLAFIVYAPNDTDTMSASRVFTSLSLLNILAQPLSTTLQMLPMLVAAHGCLQRVDAYLNSKDHDDYRLRTSECLQNPPTSPKAWSEQGIALHAINSSENTLRHSANESLLIISHGSFGYQEDDPVLHDISLRIPDGRLTIIAGPVASGKSTLCKALVGQLPHKTSPVYVNRSMKAVSYCDQQPFVRQASIKDNIIGFSHYDEQWYDSVIAACALHDDLAMMGAGDQTIVSSGGSSVSGGQKQKITLARALYARNDLLLLDDVLSGLDVNSERHIYQHVLGKDGLASRLSMTVILVTHSVQYMAEAHHLIILGHDCSIQFQGPCDMLPASIGSLAPLQEDNQAAASARAHATASTPDKLPSQTSQRESTPAESAVRPRDRAVYRYYFRAMGPKLMIIVISLGIIEAAFYTLPTYWLDVWIRVSSQLGYPKYLYWGVYALFEGLALVFLCAFVYQAFVRMVRHTGQLLHDRLLQTTMTAPLSFLSSTDTGSIINRFSQDLELVDSELPIGFLNVTLSGLFAIGHMILIVISSPWVGLAFVPILAVLYVLQKYYGRTSGQLRLLDLEAKAPLYTSFGEMISGIVTLRAYGWVTGIQQQIEAQLEQSQKPLYLLYMVQRWLTFVLDMIVAFVAIIVVTLSITTSAQSSLTGVALVQVVSLNITLRSLITAWTRVETSIGAVWRIKSFQQTTKSEHCMQETMIPPQDWPQTGNVTFRQLSARWQYVSRTLAN
jgi:ATP-binding cassette subfamily C (CFTR/MRP) protein 1